MKTRIGVLAVLCWFVGSVGAGDWPQFRGPNRDGVSTEKGLLQSWPKGGPKLLWTYKDAGMGFSSVSIVGTTMYTMSGFADSEYLVAIDIKGMKPVELWRHKVGKLFHQGSWGDGPRSTPTVAGDLVYALGGHGDLVCVDRKKSDAGKKAVEVWRKDYAKDFGGEMMSEWGFSESVLIDGDNLICTPGGAKGTLAALNKDTGKPIWQSKGLKNMAPYSSVMVGTLAKTKQYVQTSYTDNPEEEGFVSGIGIDGKVLWTKSIFKGHSYAIGPNPILHGDQVYITSGYGAGCHLFDIKNGAKLTATEKYDRPTQKTTKNTHGGVVLTDGHIYGHSETLGWVCQELQSGKIVWQERNQLSCRSGATIAADGRLYFYADDGNIALVAPNPAKQWDVQGTFSIPQKAMIRANNPNFRAAAVWAHPAIADGKLYLRDQELIFCFDIKK